MTLGTGLATFFFFALAVRSHYAGQEPSSEEVSSLDTDVLIKTGGGDVYLDGVMDEELKIRAGEPDDSGSSDEKAVEEEETT